MFSSQFLDENGFLGCQVTGRYRSKRNQLYHLTFTCKDYSKKQFVYKLYSYRNRMAVEAEMLFQLRQSVLPVPAIYKVVGNGILMEFINGPTVLDYLEWQEKTHFQSKTPYLDPAVKAIDLVIEWLVCFYETTAAISDRQMILGNINLRNFIINWDVFGVDFEDCREGCREEDAGRLCAFTLTYSNPYTLWKKSLVKIMMERLLEELELNRGQLIDIFFNELEMINKRRGLRLGSRWVEEIIGTF